MTQSLIIVTGAPGTGKSTLAPLLAQRYACTLLDKDTIKEELFDILGTGDAAWSRRLSNASFATLFALAANELARGASLLLEGNFRVGEHDDTMRAVLARGPSSLRCVQVLCTAAEPLRLARLERRASEAARHAGHLDGARTHAQNRQGFLQIPGGRCSYDSATGSQATQRGLYAALDALLQQAN